jgi:DNA-directed RNA polymerase subunit RPC12/RpoP
MELTYEFCQHCEMEVEIDSDKVSECPNCQVKILPCSTCYKEKDNSKNCNWSEDLGCWRFPKGEDNNG